MFGFGQWKFVAELNLREAHRLRFEVERTRKQRDAQRAKNEELRGEIKRLKKREKLNLKERDEARGNVGRNDLLVVGNTPSEVRVYLNGAYVPQARAVEAAQHPGELRNVALHLSAICRFVDTMDEAS